ncbi:MAG TPA: hypothetical protein VM345_07800 [Acidimicrobiales bacterium]|jgi:hypothetical protein|nr:hypothetical protein [Acidimicrobiales bacterium]
MATVAHPTSNIVPRSTAIAVAVDTWVLEWLLMAIAVIVTVASFTVGYKVG